MNKYLGVRTQHTLGSQAQCDVLMTRGRAGSKYWDGRARWPKGGCQAGPSWSTLGPAGGHQAPTKQGEGALGNTGRLLDGSPTVHRPEYTHSFQKPTTQCRAVLGPDPPSGCRAREELCQQLPHLPGPGAVTSPVLPDSFHGGCPCTGLQEPSPYSCSSLPFCSAREVGKVSRRKKFP